MRKIDQFKSKDCVRVQKLLDHFLAGELAVETNHEILLHLEHCSSCREEEEARLQTRQLLKDGWNSQSVPAGLENRIFGDLMPKSSSWSALLRMAAGLFLVATALIVFMAVQPFIGDEGTVLAMDHYDEAIHDHVHCAGEVAPAAVGLPLDDVEARMQKALSEADHPYQLSEKRLCQVGDVHFIHYVFESQGRSMSLLLEKKSDHRHITVRGDGGEKVISGLQVALLEQWDPVSLAYLETPNYFVYLVSEETQAELTLELAERVAPSLQAAL